MLVFKNSYLHLSITIKKILSDCQKKEINPNIYSLEIKEKKIYKITVNKKRDF